MNGNRNRISIWRMVYPLLAFFGLDLLATFVITSILAVNMVGESGPEAFLDPSMQIEIQSELIQLIYENANLITLVKCIPAIGLMLLFMHMDKKRLYRSGDYVTYELPGALYFLAAAVLGIFAGITGNNIIGISGLADKYAETEEMLAQMTYSGGLALEIISVVILAPVAEELVFRGLVFRRLREFTPFTLAAIFSALIFGFYHGNVIQGIYAFLVGLLCAFVCEKYHSVLASIALHIGANGFSVFATESGVLERYITTDISYISYIVISAAATLLLLWLVHDKVRPKVLIPARNSTVGAEDMRSDT